MINEAECGYFIPPDNVESLVNKLIEIKKLGKNEINKIGLKGRQWIINNRSYDKLANDYLDFISSIK